MDANPENYVEVTTNPSGWHNVMHLAGSHHVMQRHRKLMDRAEAEAEGYQLCKMCEAGNLWTPERREKVWT